MADKKSDSVIMRRCEPMVRVFATRADAVKFLATAKCPPPCKDGGKILIEIDESSWIAVHPCHAS